MFFLLKKGNKPYKVTLEVSRIAFRENKGARTALVLGASALDL